MHKIGPSESCSGSHADYVKNVEWSNRNRSKSNFFAHPPKNIASGVRLWLHLPVVQTTTAANRSRVRIFYSGHVQGVGFRYTAKTVAAGFEITGGVRNLPDGRVELIAEGERTELEAFCEAIRNAGLAGLIRDESIDWAAAQNEFHGFEIVR